MAFKRTSTREVVLIASAVLLLSITFMATRVHKGNSISDDQIQPPAIEQPGGPTSHYEKDDDDQAVQSDLKVQMDADRNQQRQIKMLKMQLEQANLQLENEKAEAEINKLKKEDAGFVKDQNPQGGSGFPSIKILYIGGAETKKEAILSIAGTSYSVRENDKPLENVEVLGITNNSVKVHFNAPQEMTTVINYVQE